VKECKVKMFVVIFFPLFAISLAQYQFCFLANLCYSVLAAVSQRVFFFFSPFISIFIFNFISQEPERCERWRGQVKILRESFFYINCFLKRSHSARVADEQEVKDIHFVIIKIEYYHVAIITILPLLLIMMVATVGADNRREIL
jgi:hypothetical protein